MSTKNFPKYTHWLGRPLIKYGFKLAYFLAAQVKISGQENIPNKGPYIITFNHVSIFDPPLVVSYWPQYPEILGAEYLWESFGMRMIMMGYGVIPVSRDYFDRKLFITTFKLLEEGNIIALAPEGKRSKKPGLLPGMPGIAYIAQKAKVQIVPVGITGTTSDMFKQAISMKRPVLRIKIGEPYRLPDSKAAGEDRKEFRQNNADIVMRKIAALLPVEYQGVYAD